MMAPHIGMMEYLPVELSIVMPCLNEARTVVDV